MQMLAVMVAYGIGSILFGVVLGRLFFGDDLRNRDNPGGSGSFRQYGPAVGTVVAALDMAKGALALLIALRMGLAGWWPALAAAAVVVGHNWPVWFGFRGGGGLGPMVGAFAVLAPTALAWALAVGLAAAAVYRLSPLYRRFRIAALPGGAVVGVPFLIALTHLQGPLVAHRAAVLCGVAVGLRGLEMLNAGKRKEAVA